MVIEDDLVDACKPGDRVQIIGEYKALPNKKGILLFLKILKMAKNARKFEKINKKLLFFCWVNGKFLAKFSACAFPCYFIINAFVLFKFFSFFRFANFRL